jgi:hypothetical protein
MHKCPVCHPGGPCEDCTHPDCAHLVLAWDMTFADPLGGVLFDEAAAVFEVSEEAAKVSLRAEVKVASSDEAWFGELRSLVIELRASVEPGTSLDGVAYDRRFLVQDFLRHVLLTIPSLIEQRDESPDSIPGFSSVERLYFSAQPTFAVAEFRRRMAVMKEAVDRARAADEQVPE